MSPQRKISLAGLVVVGLLASAAGECAASHGPGSGAKPPGGPYRPPAHGGGHYGHGGHHGHSGAYWGWSVAVGVPWALGWYSPYWWGAAYGPYYPSYAYRGVYAEYPYGYGCGLDDDCWRALQSQPQPQAPTTELPPLAAGANGGPTERPLHLNYCDSARGWFPYVRTCPGGWRLILPEYNPAR